MARTRRGISFVCVVVLANANASRTCAQSDVSPRGLWETSHGTPADDSPASASSNFNREVKITASDAVVNDAFGISLAVSGDIAIVGSSKERGADLPSSAYVYQRDEGGVGNWGELFKIEGTHGTSFGRAVAISGDILIVGAPGSFNNAGKVFMYELSTSEVNGWRKLAGRTAHSIHSVGFGAAVAISGDLAIAGHPKDYDRGDSAGAAYVYARNQTGSNKWGQVAKVFASDGIAHDYFGTSVAISGDTAIVGMWRAFDDEAIGSAYVYQQDQGGVNNWGEVAKITALDGGAGNRFGRSVAISGDTVIVGAFADGGQFNQTGSAYVYQRHAGGIDKWGEVKKITASDSEVGAFFGLGVAINGDRVMVGAMGSSSVEPSAGAVYIYERHTGGIDNWGQVAKIAASDGARSDSFGGSVALGAETAIVSAIGTGQPNFGIIGSAYIIPAARCAADSECDDQDPCTDDGCVASLCSFVTVGDVVGDAGVCGSNDSVDLFDILAVLNAFEGRFADGCGLGSVDIAGGQGECGADGVIDLADIVAVLDAFQGIDGCCAELP